MPKESSGPRGKGSSRLESNRRRRTREGPEIASVRAPWARNGAAGTKRVNKRPAVVLSSRRRGVPPVRRQGHKRKRRQDLLLGD